MRRLIYMKGAKLLIGLITVTALAGCAGKTWFGTGNDQLSGRTFLSTTVTENGKPRALVAGTTVSLHFTDDGRLIANAGCNSISGPATWSGGRIEMQERGMTAMGCPRTGVYEQDSWLSGVLGQKPSWQLTGDSLVVSTATTRIQLTDRRKVQPDMPLMGTHWTVDTVISGTTASSTSNKNRAHLTFANGRVTGSTGCNSLGGDATISGQTINFGSGPITTKMACVDNGVMAQERGILEVLKGDVTYKIESGRLTLTHPGGAGLQLTAEVTPSPTR
jgi:heat shock protein HslJ